MLNQENNNNEDKMNNTQNKFFGSKLNTVLLLFLIILLFITIWMINKNKILNMFGSSTTESSNVEEVKLENRDSSKEVGLKFKKEIYSTGKTYTYSNEGNTWSLVFLGYENQDVPGVGLKNIAAFNMVDKNNNKGKVFDTHEIVLYPNDTTSDSKVSELTNSINGQIIKRPGVVYNQLESEYYLIKLSENQNMFEAVEFYKNNERFKFVEPNWLRSNNL